MFKTGLPSKVYMGRLNKGADVLSALTDFCLENRVFNGRVEAIGAVTGGSVGYYQQDIKEYKTIQYDKPLEIVSLIGNITTKNARPFVHAHIALMDETGMVYGGHLVEGNTVFACEFIINAIEGIHLQREYDAETGLFLWAFRE